MSNKDRKPEKIRHSNSNYADDNRSENLRDSNLMAHLMDALDQGKDIGHYGQLVFAMVAQHFMDEEELVAWLEKNLSTEDARKLALEVREADYNPPKRNTILEWQAMQDFPICPDPEDPNACNVYRELRFPQDVYDRIDDFWAEKAEAEEQQE